MRFILTLVAALLGALPLHAQAQAQAPATPPETLGAAEPAATILISIDGFAPRYLDRGITPNLSALAERGATAPMTPSFPTKTFPNHYTLVTGLRPDHHGIVSNNMLDPRRPEVTFSLGNAAQALDPFWWDEAEPLWVTAERAGIRTATMFWPGSEVAIHGQRPSDWQRFDQNVSNRQRVETVLDWMRRPRGVRPSFVSLYFDTVDTAGHRFGPNSAEMNAVIAEVDERIGYLVDGLAQMDRQANIVIVSDHGMREIDEARVIQLDEMVDPGLYRLIDAGPFASIEPAAGTDRIVHEALLGSHERMECWQREDIPARFVYGSNPRVGEIFCLAEPGWSIISGLPRYPIAGGTHGWDNMDPQMQALFIAAGPDIAPHEAFDRLDNVDVYALLAALVGIDPRPNDGDDDAMMLLAGE
ncbi:ectonucleotide pyrophosphatase/phosphodiesterase [Citromicrobium bathyomarinum]|uniref:alkaline phosphatase family protein n=1 Tax=Citromicrobium bathyomarinum TaxID=72174 RepID=UPI00315AB97B